MTFSVEISPQAEKDLREIYEYIFFKLSSPKNAENQLARLEKAIYSLIKCLSVFIDMIKNLG